VKKSRPRAREGAQRTDLLSSRNWTTKAHNNYTLWDRTSGRKKGGLFLDSQPIVGPNQGGTKPRWAFLGRHCGSRPNRGSAFLGHRQWDQTKVGFSWTALWDQTKVGFSWTALWDQTKVGFSWAPLWDRTRPDKNQTRRGRRKVGFSWTPLWNQTMPDRTGPDQTKSKLGGLY
jgi:hypothetical protein